MTRNGPLIPYVKISCRKVILCIVFPKPISSAKMQFCLKTQIRNFKVFFRALDKRECSMKIEG